MNLVVANAKGRNIARGSLGSTTWVWALSRFGRISTRILAPALYASACTFSPPALQSPSQDVGGPGEDAATPDAHPDAPDAVALDASEDRDAGFEQDATDPDVGTPDLGSPDLGTPDLGVRDTGVDVGFPDTGACPPVGATPALVARAQVTHGLDQAVLVDDLDDDGIDELVVSSRADGRFSVLAPGADCTFGVATAAASLPVGGPLVAEPQSLLVTANATGLEAFSYDVQGGLSSVLTLPLGDRIDAAASSPTGTFFVATGFDGGNTGFFGLDEQNQPGWTEYGSNPLARPAYFSFPSSANYPRFVSQDGDRAVILRPQSQEYALNDGATVTPDGPLSTMAGGGGHVYIAYGSHNGSGPLITIHDVNSNNFGDWDLASPTLPSPVVGPAIGHDATGAPRFYYVLESGTVMGCEIDRGVAGFRCDPSPTNIPIHQFSVGVGMASVGLISAYVDGDDIPEIIVVDAAAGVVHFRGADLAVQAAPPVNLGRAVAGTPAYTEQLALDPDAVGLVIPHRTGEVSIVAWRRPANAGGPERIWAQDGRDPYHSSFLP